MNIIEIKLSNDGFIYRDLKKFEKIDHDDYWHGGRDWFIMTTDQLKILPW